MGITKQPGETAGLAAGAPLPEGVYFVNTLVWGEDGALVWREAADDEQDGVPVPVLFGAGDDDEQGDGDSDILLGQHGDDTLSGRAGDDGLLGGRGADHLDGGRGSDLLRGDKGDDVLAGGRGDDFLWGGEGDDSLFGGRGDEILLGGGGRDSFFVAPDGLDRIVDFDAATDVLDFSTTLYRSLDDIAPFASERNGKLVLDFGDGDVVVIRNASFDDLTMDNTVFAALPAPDDLI